MKLRSLALLSVVSLVLQSVAYAQLPVVSQPDGFEVRKQNVTQIREMVKKGQVTEDESNKLEEWSYGEDDSVTYREATSAIGKLYPSTKKTFLKMVDFLTHSEFQPELRDVWSVRNAFPASKLLDDEVRAKVTEAIEAVRKCTNDESILEAVTEISDLLEGKKLFSKFNVEPELEGILVDGTSLLQKTTSIYRILFIPGNIDVAIEALRKVGFTDREIVQQIEWKIGFGFRFQKNLKSLKHSRLGEPGDVKTLIWALARFPKQVDQVSPILESLLDNKDNDVSFQAALILAGMGVHSKKAKEILVEESRKPSAYDFTQADAIEALGKMGEFASEIVPEAVKLLSSESTWVVFHAVMALENFGILADEEEAKAALRNILIEERFQGENGQDIRFSAARTLWNLCDRSEGVKNELQNAQFAINHYVNGEGCKMAADLQNN